MSFVLTAQFVLVNVVIAVLMKHLEESNKEAKEEAELEAELELEMKTLSPQPHSPLGSPFFWPGGPESPDSPKSGALHATAHAGAASRLSLEHSTVSLHPPSRDGLRGWDKWGGGGMGSTAAQWVGGIQGVGSTADSRAPPGSFCPSCLDAEGTAVPDHSAEMPAHTHCTGFLPH